MSAIDRPVVRLALTRAEVAVAIGMSPSSVDQMVAEGWLPKPRMWRKRKLWVVRELEAALTDLPFEENHGLREKAAPADEEDWTAEL